MNTRTSLTSTYLAEAPQRSVQSSRSLRRSFGALMLAATLASPAFAVISGNVFQDFNANGVKDTTASTPNAGAGGSIGAAVDQGLASVNVTARCVTNLGPDGILGTSDDTITTYPTVTTSGTGNYTITTTPAPVAGTSCRVDFTWDSATQITGVTPNPLYGMFPTFAGSGSNTATQFVADGATVNLGLNYPADFCQNNPTLATNCYAAGSASGPSTIGGTSRDSSLLGALRSFPYSAKSDLIPGVWNGSAAAPNPPPTTLATNVQVGSTWGVAYHRNAKKLLASAHLKRHVGVGPGDLGQIYSITSAGVVTNFLNLQTLIPGSTGNNPAARTAPAYDYDLDPATKDGAGKVLIGKLGIGDLAFSDDQQTLYAVGLNARKLYKIPVGPNLIAPAAASITTINLPDPGTGATGCPVDATTPPGELNQNLRPFALKASKGFLYLGITCTAESTGNVADMRGFVYRFNPTTSAFTQVSNVSLNIAINTTNNGFANAAWNDNEPAVAGCCTNNPQPFFTDIEFDGSSMVLGFRDRFGDVTGNGTYAFDGATRIDGRANGTLIKACFSAGVYDPAACPDGYVAGQQGLGFYSNQGGPPGLTGNTDQMGTHGGLLIVPGFPDLVSSMKDTATLYDSGAGWMSNTTGTYTKGYELTFGGLPYFAKASGMGDIEALCDAAPIEIGNRIWKDTNGNGIQDPGEPSLANVTVNLYSVIGGAVPIATAVTDANGQYYFSNKTATETGVALTQVNGGPTVNAIAGLTSNTTGFKLCVDNATNYAASNPLFGLSLTKANASADLTNSPLTDLTDSDAVLASPSSPIGAGNYPCWRKQLRLRRWLHIVVLYRQPSLV
jgi:SdrD B-like domain